MSHTFQTYVDILFIAKVKILLLIKWSYKFNSQLCCLLNLEWSTRFELVVQSFLDTCLFDVCP